jgi:hypothetical protein
MATMEYICFAVDVGSNMGPRNCVNLRELDKTASHLDLALYSLLSMVNKKMIESPKHQVGIVTFGTEGAQLPRRLHLRTLQPIHTLTDERSAASQTPTMICLKRKSRSATRTLWCARVRVRAHARSPLAPVFHGG